MIILGIDPGFGRIGYGIINYSKEKYSVIEYGCITTLENSYFKELLKTIVLCLKALEKEGIITLGEINLEDELNVSIVFDYIKSVEIKEHSKSK